jgi:hypothetical protein
MICVVQITVSNLRIGVVHGVEDKLAIMFGVTAIEPCENVGRG